MKISDIELGKVYYSTNGKHCFITLIEESYNSQLFNCTDYWDNGIIRDDLDTMEFEYKTLSKFDYILLKDFTTIEEYLKNHPELLI